MKLDDLLEMLCSEIEAEDVPSAEAAIQNLNDKCENLGTIISTILLLENLSKKRYTIVVKFQSLRPGYICSCKSFKELNVNLFSLY